MNGASLVAAAVVMAISVPARAAPAVKLAYDAPPECPSQSEFVAAVTARGADFETPRATRVPAVMAVSIARAQDGFTGAFRVRDDGEATSKREVRGADCREVADALAVVTAIALQGDATAGRGEAPVAPAPPPSVAVASPPPPQAPPPPESSKPRLRGHTPWFPKPSVAVPAGTVRFDVAGSATLYAGAAVGLIPSVVLPRYDLGLNVASYVTLPDGSQRIPGLVLRVHVGYLGPGTYRSSDTKTDILGFAYGIDLCLSPRYDTDGLVLLFCLGYGGGYMQLTTSEQGTSLPTKTEGFGQVTLSSELQYNLAAHFQVGLRLEGASEFGEISAEDVNGNRIFASQPYSADALLGVGFHW